MVVVKRRGKYVVDYYDSSGVRRRPSFDTKTEAETFMQSGIDCEPTKAYEAVTLKDAIRRYYDTVSIRKGQKTYRYEKYYFSKFYEFLSSKENGLSLLREVKLMHLEKYQTKMLAGTETVKGCAASTVNRHFTTLRAFLNKCADWDLIAASPAKKLKQLPENPAETLPWDDEHLTDMLKRLPRWAGDVIYFLGETGARPSETGRLVFDDIDFERKLVACSTFKGTGEKVTRYLPMSANLAQFLLAKYEHAKKFLGAKGTDLVFLNSKDKPVTSDTLGDVVRETRRLLGLPQITSYGLRHAYISRLVDMNVHQQKIKALAGHRKDATTAKYVKLKQEGLRQVVTDLASVRQLRR